METLVHNYAFSGTLLILGSCMLHISISAALYRPLGVHVQITNKKSPHQNNVVKLTQASEDDIIMEQQHLLNKEIPEVFKVFQVISSENSGRFFRAEMVSVLYNVYPK